MLYEVITEINRQKGYAADALQLVCNYAKERLGLHQLYANIGANNEASCGLFEKCGFTLSGTKKEWLNSPKGRIDEHIYQRIL